MRTIFILILSLFGDHANGAGSEAFASVTVVQEVVTVSRQNILLQNELSHSALDYKRSNSVVVVNEEQRTQPAEVTFVID
jgi:hypothetical protein